MNSVAGRKENTWGSGVMFDFILENALQMVVWPVMKQIRLNRTMKNKAKGRMVMV